MNLPQPLPNRQSIRLKNFDYSSEGAYFITLVTQDRIQLFGKIESGEMILNILGKIVEEEWKNTLLIRPNISIGTFAIMPDHMHMILHIDKQIKNEFNEAEWNNSNPKSPSQTIGAIIRGFKGAATKKINLFINSIGTGELQFAPTIELQFARKASENYSSLNNHGDYIAIRDSGESQFAPTIPFKIWQRNYYERIIRDQNAYDNIEKYIQDNPKNWKKK